MPAERVRGPAGTTGRVGSLLGRYAWYAVTSQIQYWPCGGLKPNELGLFDMLGNVIEWCQDDWLKRPDCDRAIDNSTNMTLVIDNRNFRVLRGGSFFDGAGLVRSAFRHGGAPASRNMSGSGFRLSRTYP